MSSDYKRCTCTQQTLCSLCHKHHNHMSSPSQWICKEALDYVASLQIPPEADICRPCRVDISKIIKMPSHVPRWTRQENIVAKCCLIGCEEDSSVATHIPSADIAKALQVKGFTVQNGIPSPAPLCQAHYHMVYNTITPTQVICTTCGTLLKSFS